MISSEVGVSVTNTEGGRFSSIDGMNLGRLRFGGVKSGGNGSSAKIESTDQEQIHLKKTIR